MMNLKNFTENNNMDFPFKIHKHELIGFIVLSIGFSRVEKLF